MKNIDKNVLSKMKGKVIAFDLDSTLTIDEVEDYLNKTPNEVIKEMEKLIPDVEMINLLNKIAENNTVYIYTARNDCFQDVTNKWLKNNGVNCHYFLHNKEFYDYFIDDKVIHPIQLK